jgi:hypothetical protein
VRTGSPYQRPNVDGTARSHPVRIGTTRARSTHRFATYRRRCGDAVTVKVSQNTAHRMTESGGSPRPRSAVRGGTQGCHSSGDNTEHDEMTLSGQTASLRPPTSRHRWSPTRRRRPRLMFWAQLLNNVHNEHCASPNFALANDPDAMGHGSGSLRPRTQGHPRMVIKQSHHQPGGSGHIHGALSGAGLRSECRKGVGAVSPPSTTALTTAARHDTEVSLHGAVPAEAHRLYCVRRPAPGPGPV